MEPLAEIADRVYECTSMSSRRTFLRLISAAALSGSIADALWAQDSPGLSAMIPGKLGMIMRSYRFLDLETPTDAISSWITPVEHFFVRNHMFEPTTIDVRTWKLTVSGEVEHPLELNISDIRKFPPASITNTLECAGNGRAFYQPHVPGVQWQKGAVGNAVYSGVRLKDLLKRAAVKSTGRHVMFRGLDEVPGKVPPFIRSIPIEKALDPNTLLGTHMNGAELPKHHGFPVRCITPGWIGAASVKWLTEIRVLDREFDGNFMSPGYRLPNQPVKPGEAVNPADTTAITALNVKSIITKPVDGSLRKLTPISISGAAWAGEAQIKAIEISVDGGKAWEPAQFGREQAPYAWRLWHHVWKPSAPGDYIIRARATDDRGRTQPLTAQWNPSGYLYNAIDEVKVHVER